MEATRYLVEKSQGKAVRLEDIARQAGVSRQAIYLHFGSRVGLLVATVQYVDESSGFFERTRHVREAEDGLTALELFVAFWADYMPGISNLAKVLQNARDHDPAAAAAWDNRMDGLWRICRYLASWIERDGRLDPVWTADTAADFMSRTLLLTWESLVSERGWSRSDYVDRLQHTFNRAFRK